MRDTLLLNGTFAFELRPSIDVLRIRRIIFVVRGALRSIEHILRGIVHECGAYFVRVLS
jgi:hypothetical protein